MKQLIVALDVDTIEQALSLAGRLRGLAGGFKIGSRLFTVTGRQSSKTWWHAATASSSISSSTTSLTLSPARSRRPRGSGVWMIDVHAGGGAAMMRAAKDAANEAASRLSRPAPLIIAVTVLTSFDEPALADVGVAGAGGRSGETAGAARTGGRARWRRGVTSRDRSHPRRLRRRLHHRDTRDPQRRRREG